MRERLGEVAVIVEESHPDDLMGIYDPVGGLQRIVIFRDAEPERRRRSRRTVWHEIGHHLGMGEAEHASSAAAAYGWRSLRSR